MITLRSKTVEKRYSKLLKPQMNQKSKNYKSKTIVVMTKKNKMISKMTRRCIVSNPH